LAFKGLNSSAHLQIQFVFYRKYSTCLKSCLKRLKCGIVNTDAMTEATSLVMAKGNTSY